jgi:hypothetical protein
MFGRQSPRHVPANIEHTTAPVEPSAADRDRDQLVAQLDRIFGRCTASSSSRELWDALLDARNAVRPARQPQVPVIPGRPT